MVEPVTMAALSAVALTEGIKFLYGQAGELLRWRRERKDAGRDDEPIAIEAAEIVEGELQPATPDQAALDRLEDDIRTLRRGLGDYAEDADPKDLDTVRTADALRRALEAVLGQTITFKGEDREPSGVDITSRVDVEEVEGYVAGVRAEGLTGGKIDATVKAGDVRPDGEVVGADLRSGRTDR